MRILATIFGLIALVSTFGQAQAVIVVHTTDFIADANRSHFNGFESIPTSGTVYTGGSGPYVEDTIEVTQINGDADITTAYNIWPGAQGTRTWYPTSGDHGYTRVRLDGGGDFENVGFNYGSGRVSISKIIYELWNDSGFVTGGMLSLSTSSVNYLGFSGGGFDTILMKDNYGGGTTITDGQEQFLAIDNIETELQTVPEPSSMILLGLGALGMGVGALRRRRLRSTQV